jgi:hypothetical protein
MAQLPSKHRTLSSNPYITQNICTCNLLLFSQHFSGIIFLAIPVSSVKRLWLIEIITYKMYATRVANEMIEGDNGQTLISLWIIIYN